MCSDFFSAYFWFRSGPWGRGARSSSSSSIPCLILEPFSTSSEESFPILLPFKNNFAETKNRGFLKKSSFQDNFMANVFDSWKYCQSREKPDLCPWPFINRKQEIRKCQASSEDKGYNETSLNFEDRWLLSSDGDF